MSHVPYGYKIVDAKAVIDDPVAEKVKTLFVEFIACGSMRAAAKKAGIEKTHSVIGRIISNQVYLGTEYYPQLIDTEIFQKANALKVSNAKAQNRIKEYKPVEEATAVASYYVGKIDTKFEDLYQQAEYAYSLIQEAEDE